MSTPPKREQWKSRLGFVWAAVGSAIGLGSIWRFPYVVGENGGATFVLLYFVCLLLVALPVLVSEILIGRKTQLSPSAAFQQIGKKRAWQKVGGMTVLTGFLVSTFYAVVAGWTLGYLIQALLGKLNHFSSAKEATAHFTQFSASPLCGTLSLIGFLLLSATILLTGVQKGIERGNKIMMPLLLFVLLFLAGKGLLMPGGTEGLVFLFDPQWSEITPIAILTALGQAFFSLSLGQGTMVTYGSYLKKGVNIPGTALSVAVFSLAISLLAGVAIFAIVFFAGLSPTAGESLMFQTLPLIFSEIPGGYLLSILFFLLLVLAALTSEISAMEPLIAYFIDVKKWKRSRAVTVATAAVFLIALPATLSFGPWKELTLFGKNLFHLLVALCLNVLIPLGGLCAALLVGWRWTLKRALPHLKDGAEPLFKKCPFLECYFEISIRYLAPLIILIILLDALGIF